MTRRLALIPWIVLAGAATLRAVEAGIRGNFGLFFHPLNREFGWDRGSVSLAMSIGMLVWALVLPFGGRLCDRYGPRRVMAVGLTLVAVALVGSSTATKLWQLYFWWGVVGGMGWGMGGTVGAVTLAARWFTQHRGLAVSITIAGVSAGSMVIVPIAAALFSVLDWQGVLLVLALMTAGVAYPLILFVLKDNPPAAAPPPMVAPPVRPSLPPRVSLFSALGRGPYRLVVVVYFTCGVVGMAMPVHIIPYAMDRGLSALGAARAMSVFSAMAIAGVVVFGALSDRLGRKKLLALGYVLRLLGLLLLLGARGEGVLLAAAVLFGIGFNIPGGLIPALVADVYGLESVGLLTGFLSTVHQVAGALGVWYAGYLFDATGSYTVPFLSMAGLSLLSAVGSLFIIEKRRMAVATVPQATP